MVLLDICPLDVTERLFNDRRLRICTRHMYYRTSVYLQAFSFRSVHVLCSICVFLIACLSNCKWSTVGGVYLFFFILYNCSHHCCLLFSSSLYHEIAAAVSYENPKERTKVDCFSYYLEQISIRSRYSKQLLGYARSRYVLSRTVD